MVKCPQHHVKKENASSAPFADVAADNAELMPRSVVIINIATGKTGKLIERPSAMKMAKIWLKSCEDIIKEVEVMLEFEPDYIIYEGYVYQRYYGGGGGLVYNSAGTSIEIVD